MNLPLQLRFKIVSFSSKIEVTDADGELVCFVKKKKFKFKEHVVVYADQDMKQPLYEIKADSIMDFSATYQFTTQDGSVLGSVARKGMRSLWRAHYLILLPDGSTQLEIRERNAWTKVLDSVLADIPIVGLFSGYFFNPSYRVLLGEEEDRYELFKQPAMWEGVYSLERKEGVPADDEGEKRVLLSLLMMILLERYRG
ncbi:MAG: hypothetical protein AAF191_19515 [Verrucomicrobiota bacterium]